MEMTDLYWLKNSFSTLFIYSSSKWNFYPIKSILYRKCEGDFYLMSTFAKQKNHKNFLR